MSVRRHRGVTALELIIVVAVMGVILLIAMPSFMSMMANQRIKTTAESLRAGLQSARMEAIKRGRGVVFSMATLDSSWIVGCEIPISEDNDGDGLADCPAQIQFSASVVGGADSITITSDDGTLATFTPIGLVRQVNQDGSTPFTQINVTAPLVNVAGLRPMRVLLPAGGLSRICDPAVTDSGDTRKC